MCRGHHVGVPVDDPGNPARAYHQQRPKCRGIGHVEMDQVGLAPAREPAHQHRKHRADGRVHEFEPGAGSDHVKGNAFDLDDVVHGTGGQVVMVHHGEIGGSPSVERNHDVAHVVLHTPAEGCKKFSDVQDPEHQGCPAGSACFARHQPQRAGVMIEMLIDE